MKLKKINLNKSFQTEDSGYSHPDIRLGKWYLAQFGTGAGTELVAGKFTNEWYGLCFNEYQFDPPGCNSSDWVSLWEMVR